MCVLAEGLDLESIMASARSEVEDGTGHLKEIEIEGSVRVSSESEDADDPPPEVEDEQFVRLLALEDAHEGTDG